LDLKYQHLSSKWLSKMPYTVYGPTIKANLHRPVQRDSLLRRVTDVFDERWLIWCRCTLSETFRINICSMCADFTAVVERWFALSTITAITFYKTRQYGSATRCWPIFHSLICWRIGLKEKTLLSFCWVQNASIVQVASERTKARKQLQVNQLHRTSWYNVDSIRYDTIYDATHSISPWT